MEAADGTPTGCNKRNPFVIQIGESFAPFRSRLVAVKDVAADDTTIDTIADDFVTQFLLDIQQQLEIYVSHNVTTTSTYFTSPSWLADFEAMPSGTGSAILYAFFKMVFTKIINIVDLGVSGLANTMKLSVQSQFSIIVILSGLYKSMIFLMLKQCHEKNVETGKTANIKPLEDILGIKETSEFRRAINEVINLAFSTVAAYKNTFQNTVASYCAFFFISSPTLATEYIKLAKPLGKTFLQSQPQLTTLLISARTVKSYQKYSMTYQTVIRAQASSWFVADVINATAVPKDSTFTAYKPLLSLFTSLTDISLAEGVVADVYNPDITQTMLKALKIRPAVAIHAITYLLNNTISSDRNKKRHILSASTAQSLLATTISESRQADVSRKKNGAALFCALMNHVAVNNPESDLIALSEVFVDVIYQRNNQTLPTAPDQKLSLLQQMDAMLDKTAVHNTTVFTVYTSALLFLLNKESLREIKVSIVTIISKYIEKFQTVPAEFVEVVMKLFINLDLSKLEEITLYSHMLPVFISGICINKVQNKAIITQMLDIITKDSTQQQLLLAQLLKLIQFSTTRPALFSSLLSYVLFYFTIIAKDASYLGKPFPAEITTVLTSTSPFTTTVQYNVDCKTDALTTATIFSYLTTLNQDLLTITQDITADTKLVASIIQNNATALTNKKYTQYIGLFIGLVNYICFNPENPELAEIIRTTITMHADNAIFSIWFQFGLMNTLNKIKATSLAQFFALPDDLSTVNANTAVSDVISPYTAQFIPLTSQTQTLGAYERLYKVLTLTTISPAQVTTLTPQQTTVLLSALLLASHPLLATKAAGNTVQQFVYPVQHLYQSYYKNNHAVDYSALFSNKQAVAFVIEMLFGAESAQLFGWFFTPTDPATAAVMKPDLSALTLTALKSPASTSALDASLSHAAIVFASFYSKISPIVFHTQIVPHLVAIFKANCTKMFTLLTPYHIAVWNTKPWELCNVDEPKDLYADEIEAGLAPTPEDGKKAAGKSASAAPILSAQEQQKQTETTIRTNITNVTRPVTVICCLLDYLIYVNKNYARDEILFIFYSTILQAMAGLPIKTKKTVSSPTGYEEVYTIAIYKDTCIPLLLSLCNSVDSHFSEDPDHVAILQQAISIILLKHDNRTHNIFKLALTENKNIDMTTAQKEQLQHESIDSLLVIVDCLKQLSTTTKSLHFTPSSFSFIFPILTAFNDNIEVIIDAMNYVAPKKATDEIAASPEPTAEDEDAELALDDVDEDVLEEDEIVFSKKSPKIKYQRDTLCTALLHALLAIAQILSNHAKPASATIIPVAVAEEVAPVSVNTYPFKAMLSVASSVLSNVGTTTSSSSTVLTNIPSTTTIQPITIIELLIDTLTRLVTTLDSTNVELFVDTVLSLNGLLSPVLPTRLAFVAGLEKSKLLSASFDQLPADAQQRLTTYLFTSRFDTDSDISSMAYTVFNKFPFSAVFLNGKHSLTELSSLLSILSRAIRTAAGAALPYALIAFYTQTTDVMTAETTFSAQLDDADLVTEIDTMLTRLIAAFKEASDYTIKKQTIRDTDTFVSNGYKRQAIVNAALQLSTLFSPLPTTTGATTNGSKSQYAFDFSKLTAKIIEDEKRYLPLLSRFFTTIVELFVKDADYDVWDSAVYAGSTLIHTHASADSTIELFSNILQDSLTKCEGKKDNDGQKEGIVILLSALSHYLNKQKHEPLLQQIFNTLISTIQAIACPAESGTMTPVIDSVQKSIHSALVTISRQLPRDVIMKFFNQHYITAFTTKQFPMRVASVLVMVSVIKALGGIFLLKETTLFSTLSAVLTLNQPDGGKLDKKQHAQLLNDCTSKIPKGGDKVSNIAGALTTYYYLFTFLPQQMSVQIPTILPKILVFFGYENNMRDLTHNLAQVMMKCASTTIPGGAKIILPLLLGGLRESAAWRTKVCSLQLLSSIVTFSSKDLSTVLPSIIPLLIELRRDPNQDVASEAAKVLDLLGSVIKNPQLKKISRILVNALHHTNVATVTRALEALYTTVFMHYVDPIALAVVMPIVFYGLSSERNGDVKKVAVQIAGSVSMITSNLNDISPYISRLLNLMQITLMDSTPEVRSVTAKAIAQMVRTQQQSFQSTGEESHASKALLAQFDMLLTLLLDMLSLKRVRIPTPAGIIAFASDGTTAVQRSGCSFGISQLMHTRGIDYLDQVYESTILDSLSSRDPVIREGYTELMYHLPQVFQQDFAPLVVKTLPVIVGLLGDPHALVRDYAQQSSQCMVQLFATTQTQELLATILEALVDSDYRVRTGATVLAACFLLRCAGIEGEISIAEAEDDAASMNKIETEIRDKTAITSEKQELLMLEYFSVDNRNEIYSSLFLMCSDYVTSVSIVANRVFKAVTPSMSRMLNNILPRLVERITADLASFDEHRKFTAGKSLSDLVHKLGDRILRDIVPILLDKFNSIDVYTRSGICLGLSQIFLSATKSMLSPYNPDLFPLLQLALCDREEMVRESATIAFGNYCRAITSEKVVDAIVPLLLTSIDTFHNKYLELSESHEPIEWADVFDDHPLYRYRHSITHHLYDPAEDALAGLREIVALSSCQKQVLNEVIPFFLNSPISQYHVHCIATITQVCGKSFGYYLGQVIQSLAEALSAFYNVFYNENDFEYVNEPVERYGDDEETEEEFQARKASRAAQLVLYEKLKKQEADLAGNAFNVFVGLAPMNYYEILETLFAGLSNSNFQEFEDQCAWLKMMSSFWLAISKLNGMSTNLQSNIAANTNNRGQRIDVSGLIDLEDFGMNTTSTLQTIIQFFSNDHESLLTYAAESLHSFLLSAHPDSILKYITFIRTQLNDITGKSRKPPYHRKISELTVFNNKELTATIFAIAQHGLVTLVSQPTIRTQCSAIMLDVVDLTSTEGMSSHAMKLVGFLIRTFPDKLSVDIKANILSTIALLLKKCSAQLKAFQTQLKTLLTKTLLYVDEKQEAAAKPVLNASGQIIVAAVDNRNVIVDSDLLCERAAFTMSFLAQPQAFFSDLVQGVLVHQHKIVAGKIAKSITQILSNRLQFETISKAVVLENIHKLVPTLSSEDAHDSVRIEVSRIVGMLVSLIPLEDAYVIISNILASCQIPSPPFPDHLVEKGIPQPVISAQSSTPPSMKTRQSTAMVFSSVLISSQDLFAECVGFRPAIAFIARGFKDTEELSLTATIRFAGRLLAHAAKNQHDNAQLSQIVRMLTQELLNLASTTQCNTEAVLVCILTQVRSFAETDYDAANDLINVIVPLCIRARAGAAKAVRKEIDVILHYTLLFNDSYEIGFQNAEELAQKLSKADAAEFLDLCKRSVSKAVEKKKDMAEEEW